MSELILGTVQLGIDYGINNRKGKPSLDESFEILNTAYDKGIKIIDTALGYGDSENIIGSFMKMTNKHFEMITKLPKFNRNELLIDQLNDSIKHSCAKLGVSKIDYYLYHNFQDILLYPDTFEYLLKLKDKGIIGKIGVSIYDIEEMDYLINNMLKQHVDIIQLPFNIFDLRWIKGDWFKKAKEKGIEISVRSVFLQGLFFLSEKKSFTVHCNTYQYIEKLNTLSKIKNITIEQLALSYVKSIEEIDWILIGCENKMQLTRNIDNFSNEINFSKEDIEYINNNFGCIEKKIIDPRLWKQF
jgi:aryl-alcohol dehydrogenase-like predicted oxidoreductase